MKQRTDEQEVLALAAKGAKDGDYEEAIIQLKNLLDAYPKHELGLGMLASIYAELKMNDRAVEFYERLLAVNPKNPLACLQLGLMQAAAQRPREVVEIWKARLDEPEEYLAHYFTGLALLSLDKSKEARTMLEHSAQYMPKDYALYPSLQELISGLRE